ncbi:phosphopyruvate hydratase [Candidatus Pelagibacter communis]|uniref:phosphopyruvate hydratase n=1 Tax=Pelagibacter ubique TaxID=198252 RepID=UPI00094D3E89|nr:phosphopyruvate hydratase [Candidatus Pelagibacter ubique]
MAKIQSIKGRQVFDSRGNPTVEAEVFLENNISATAISPSGASTGAFEAHELRDQDKNKFLGKSVNIAVENINKKISNKLKGLESEDQKNIDKVLINLDGSENKSNLGANATLAVSLANSKCSALSNKKSLFRHLGNSFTLPIPLMNIINGGAHADNDLNIQEFMIRPDSAKTFLDAIEKCFVVIQNLKKLLKSKKMLTNVGDEGGFAPSINTNEQALDFIVKAIEQSKLEPGKDITICLDVAANELINENGDYAIQSKNFTSVEDNIDYYKKLISNYPIKSIEDPFAEEDWNSWKKITNEIGNNVQIVGDDLFVTNSKRLSKGIKEKSANCILVKPNQIGTLTETLEVISMAKDANLNTIISHRSGDTEDTFIADLASATMSSQIKTGSLARSERVAKYNRLLRIEEELGNQAKMARI